jgi:hypothetical protein
MRKESTIPRRFIVSLVALWLAASVHAAAESECAELEGASVQTHIAYLQRDRSKLKDACIHYAMFQIARPLDQQSFDRYPESVKTEATETLARYLDYRPPMTKLEEATLGSHDPYTANTALFMIGRAAVSALIGVIADAASPGIASSNAMWVIYIIYGVDRPEAVRVLKRAAAASEDFATSERLLEAARKMADMYCHGAEANPCRDALYETDTEGKPRP